MRIVSLVGLTLLASCVAPSKLAINTTATATEELRLKEYEKYKATTLNQTTYTTEDGSVIETGRYGSVVLGNKQTIKDPRALANLVAKDSTAAKAIKTYEQKQRRERILLGVNWTGIVTSITLMGVGATLVEGGGETLTPAGKATVTSGALLLGGLAITGIMRLGATDEKRTARSEAFLAYNESLRAQLSLCEEGSQIFDCQNAPNFAAQAISMGSDPNNPATFDSCEEQRILGFSLSEDCQKILRRGAPQKAPEPDSREPDLAEQEFALLLSLAEVSMRAGKHEEAFARLEEARKLRPDEPVLLFAFGEVHRSKGSLGEACEHYRLYLKNPSADPNTSEEITNFLAGVDKEKNKACDFNPAKP
jgi:tetratricopeptide (TPR) repeat protein